MDVLNIIILCLIFICNILGKVAFIMHFTNKKNNILGTSNMKVKFPKKKIDEMIKILTDSKKYIESNYWVNKYINILKCVKKYFKDNNILKDIYEYLKYFQDLVQKVDDERTKKKYDFGWKKLQHYFRPWNEIYYKFKSLNKSFKCGENFPD